MEEEQSSWELSSHDPVAGPRLMSRCRVGGVVWGIRLGSLYLSSNRTSETGNCCTLWWAGRVNRGRKKERMLPHASYRVLRSADGGGLLVSPARCKPASVLGRCRCRTHSLETCESEYSYYSSRHLGKYLGNFNKLPICRPP